MNEMKETENCKILSALKEELPSCFLSLSPSSGDEEINGSSTLKKSISGVKSEKDDDIQFEYLKHKQKRAAFPDLFELGTEEVEGREQFAWKKQKSEGVIFNYFSGERRQILTPENKTQDVKMIDDFLNLSLSLCSNSVSLQVKKEEENKGISILKHSTTLPYCDYQKSAQENNFTDNQDDDDGLLDLSRSVALDLYSGGSNPNKGHVDKEHNIILEENKDNSDEQAANHEGVQWDIRKILTKSDCNGRQCRLMIKKDLAVKNIIDCQIKERKEKFKTEARLGVDVFDFDTRNQVELMLKKWETTGCYVLIGGWKKYFVDRRMLKAGDEVGLCWDQDQSRLLFTVLNRM